MPQSNKNYFFYLLLKQGYSFRRKVVFPSYYASGRDITEQFGRPTGNGNSLNEQA